MIERLSQEILEDDYFFSLYGKASQLIASDLFMEEQDNINLTPKELKDLLRFSDILSHSTEPNVRNKAYKILTLLNARYASDPYYRTYAHSVMAKLGNFPAIDYLRTKDNNLSELPFERVITKTAKEFVQAVPFIEGMVFTDSQYELFTQLSESKFFSFSGPTSMGKSFIIKSFIRKAMSNKPPENIAIMVPTRALINQFSLDLNKEVKAMLDNFNYRVVTNSSVPDLPSTEAQHYLFVLTPERLISYLSKPTNPLIGYLFVDEAHKIAAEKDVRAVTAYNAISRALRMNPALNLYFASPNVSNPEIFLKLFGKDEQKVYKTSESPVAQNLFYIDLVGREVTHYTDLGPVKFQPQLVTSASSINELFKKMGGGGTNIIYCSAKKNAVEKARSLFEGISDDEISISPEVKKVIRQIRVYIHKDYYLADFLQKGIAYHYGNLPQIIRNKVESLFKDSKINYVFCTSTLLEGVNLPAKNVFILNNKNGLQFFQPIDFWNLAGRAGRLKYELSGNIFCLRETTSEWEKHNDLLGTKIDIVLATTVDNLIDKKLKKIEKLLIDSREVIKPLYMQEILKYIANIICIETMEIDKANYQSPVIKKLIEQNSVKILELAKERTATLVIPYNVVVSNQSVKIDIQNKIYKELKEQHEQGIDIRLPGVIDFETCKAWLKKLYDLFEWKTEVDVFRSTDQLNYYATLMNQWISGFPLNGIISSSITYNHGKKNTIAVGWEDKRIKFEVFDKDNKAHVNILISNIIDDIEKVLRFVLEKYFNNYQAIVIAILGEENAGTNWANFLEYGTKIPIMIALQNLGLSRHAANYVFSSYRSCLKIDGDKLVDIDVARLRIMLNKEDIEYDEISAIFFN